MPRTLTATYRVQLNSGFTLDECAAIVPYLNRLGISHLYLSPCLQAAPGSGHGYDVVDPTRVNDELGGHSAYDRLSAALSEHNLGQVLDLVPNHMSIESPLNRWWWDVLRNGPGSEYADYFDIDWEGPDPPEQGKVLLPVLGEHLEQALQNGQIMLAWSELGLVLRYYDHSWPVRWSTVSWLLQQACQQCSNENLIRLTRDFETAATDADATQTSDQLQALNNLLIELVRTDADVRAAVGAVLDRINSEADACKAVIDDQFYRPGYWRDISRRLNYRRFFDINSLIGLRVEDPEVFDHVHSLVFSWLGDGKVDGLRIDHPDGLRDPRGYFDRLRDACPDAWIVVEKILERDESLPNDWPVAGTTGYDFLNQVGGLFIDAAGEQPLTDFYQRFSGQDKDYATLLHEKKRFVLDEILVSDVSSLAHALTAIAQGHEQQHDITHEEARIAIRELAAAMPVYRCYVRPADSQVSDSDRRYVHEALQSATQACNEVDASTLQFIARILLLEIEGEHTADFVSRFQQLTGPAMAKGAEDTAFYCYNRLICLNEVGGDPGVFGTSVEAFHEFCQRTQHNWPLTMLTTSTHDTKRSEDVRARLALLSGMPQPWIEAVTRWREHNEQYRSSNKPDRNAEYLLYQTLVGAWPIGIERVQQYMEKASREAKEHTSWVNADQDYDQALRRFIDGIMNDEWFMNDLQAFVEPLIEPGRVNSLAQLLIKLTAPGVPDIYQGTVSWNLSLVDPDNRRPVDYGRAEQVLARVESASAQQAWEHSDEGWPKAFVLQKALQLRQQVPHVFGEDSDYNPVAVTGQYADCAIAFSRHAEVITVVPLLHGRRPAGQWGDTAIELPAGVWTNVLTNEQHAAGDVRLDELLGQFPVALLRREERRS